MFSKGMIMVVIGIGGLIITILLGIIFFINSKKKVKALRTYEQKENETFNNIAKNLGSYNSVQNVTEDFTELLSKESTELLNENSTVLLVCNCCGNAISEDDRFCQNCGAEMAKLDSLANVCNCCGNAISEDDKFCENCGTKIAKSNGESTVFLNEESTELLKKKSESTVLLQSSEDSTELLKDEQINN